MSLSEFTPKEITGPRGAWSFLAQKRKGNPEHGSACQNVRFAPGIVRTRPGTLPVTPATGPVTGMFNWIAPNGSNWVSYRDADKIQALLQEGATTTLLDSIANTYRPSFADLDVWEYFCGYDKTGVGQFQGRTFDGFVDPITGIPNVDKAFAPPVHFVNGVITQDTATGQVTIGNHYFGFVYQNRDGFSGVPTTLILYGVTATSNTSPNTFTVPGNTLQDGFLIYGSLFAGDTSANGGPWIVRNPGVSGPGTFQLEDPNTSTLINGNGPYTGGGILAESLTFETTSSPARILISVTVPALLDGGSNPSGGQANLALIATPVSNPDAWFFVPTASSTSTSIVNLPIPYNQQVTLNFIYDTDDFSLQQGDSANNQFLLLSMANISDTTGPFFPSFVKAYGQRMCYGNGTTLYASDINQPQQVTPDNNAVTMPNQRKIGYAFALPGGTDLYLTGEKWTARVTDNSDIPATWSQPVKVSDAIGSPLPNCVCDRTGGGWVWMVTEGGVYLFSGVFQEKPLTYLIGDLWVQVNWHAAYAIEIADDIKNLKLYIAVPLGASTVPNVVIVIDYQNCADSPNFDQVDCSTDVYDRASFGGIGVIYEQDTQSSNLWIGPDAPVAPATSGNIMRLWEPEHNDVSGADPVPINCFWESGLVRSGRELNTAMIRIGGMDVWVRGHSNVAGTPAQAGPPPVPAVPPDFLITVWGPNHQQSQSPYLCVTGNNAVVLVEQPGLTYKAAKFDMRHIENYTVQFSSNALDTWFELSGFISYSVPDLVNR